MSVDQTLILYIAIAGGGVILIILAVVSFCVCRRYCIQERLRNALSDQTNYNPNNGAHKQSTDSVQLPPNRSKLTNIPSDSSKLPNKSKIHASEHAMQSIVETNRTHSQRAAAETAHDMPENGLATRQSSDIIINNAAPFRLAISSITNGISVSDREVSESDEDLDDVDIILDDEDANDDDDADDLPTRPSNIFRLASLATIGNESNDIRGNSDGSRLSHAPSASYVLDGDVDYCAQVGATKPYHDMTTRLRGNTGGYNH